MQYIRPPTTDTGLLNLLSTTQARNVSVQRLDVCLLETVNADHLWVRSDFPMHSCMRGITPLLNDMNKDAA